MELKVSGDLPVFELKKEADLEKTELDALFMNNTYSLDIKTEDVSNNLNYLDSKALEIGQQVCCKELENYCGKIKTDNPRDETRRWTVVSSVLLPCEEPEESLSTEQLDDVLPQSAISITDEHWQANSKSSYTVLAPSLGSSQVSIPKFKCSICSKQFTKKKYCTTHERTHTREKPFKCAVCGKGFLWIALLNNHERIHTGEKPFQCTLCGRMFSQAGNLSKHLLTHTGEKPYKCTVCGKGFGVSGHLARHMRIHTGEKPYKCTICCRLFTDSASRNRHERRHTEEKPYKCTSCGRGFRESGSLTTHMRRHTGEKPYKCPICGKGFAEFRGLKNHQRSHN